MMMNKDVIRELIDLRTDILAVKPLPNIMQLVIDKLNNIIIDSIDEDQENETCCTCEDCPVMKKIDNLAVAIDQGYMMSKRTGQPFKIECIENELKTKACSTGYDIFYNEAEKMARGGTD